MAIEHNVLSNTANMHGIVKSTVATPVALAAVTPSATEVADRAVWRRSDAGTLWVPRANAAGSFALLGPKPDYYVRDDFDSVMTTAGAAAIANGTLFGNRPWRCGLTGAATGCTAVTTNQDASHYGVIDLATGTSGTGATDHIGSAVSVMTFGAGQFWMQQWIVRIPTLSDGTNTYALRLGYFDTLAGPTNGLYFEYSSATSVNWRGCSTTGGSVTVASGGTSVPVAAGAWISLIVTWDGTNFTFYVDGVSIGTTAVAPGGAVLHMGVKQSAGGTSRSVLIDLYEESLWLTSPRAA